MGGKLMIYVAPKVKLTYQSLFRKSMKPLRRKGTKKYMHYLLNGWTNGPVKGIYSKNAIKYT